MIKSRYKICVITFNRGVTFAMQNGTSRGSNLNHHFRDIKLYFSCKAIFKRKFLLWSSTTGLEDLKVQFSMKIHTFATCHRIYIVWTVVESRIDVYTLCVRNWRGSPLHWNLHCHFLKIKIQALDWRSVLVRNQTGEKKLAPINSVEGKYAFWKNLRNRLHFAKPVPLAAHNGGAL